MTPLLGVHHTLLGEKKQRLIDVGRRLDAALATLHQRMESGELQGMTDLQAGIDTLVKERELLESISTWPWSTDTLRLALTTLLLPVVLLLIQRLIDFFWHI